jgi:hypothetical protein
MKNEVKRIIMKGGRKQERSCSRHFEQCAHGVA